MIGSLTFLPAVLSYLGQKNWLEKGRVPYVAKRRHKTAASRASGTPSSTASWPARCVSAVLAGGLLVALSIPALGMQFKEPGTEGMSRSQPIIQTLDRIDARLPRRQRAGDRRRQGQGRHDARGPVRDQGPARQGDRHGPAVASPRASTINPDKTVAVVSLSIKGKGTDAASNRSIEVLRERGRPGHGRPSSTAPRSP